MYSLFLKIYFFQGGTLAHCLSPPLSFSFSLYASLSCSSSLFLFFSSPPPLNQPYIHPMPLYLFSLSCSSPLFLTSSSLHWPYIHPMNLYLFSLPCSSSPSIFNLNLRSYGQLFILVFLIKNVR